MTYVCVALKYGVGSARAQPNLLVNIVGEEILRGICINNIAHAFSTYIYVVVTRAQDIAL